MRSKTTSSLAAIAMLSGAATPALAAAPVGFAGVLNGQYGRTDGPGTKVNTWSAGGQAAFGLSPELGAEINGGFSNLDGGSGLPTADLWNIGGSAFYAPELGRLGATLNHQSVSGGGASLNFTQYGGFGEYYVNDNFTAGINAGGISVGNCPGCSNGGYVNGGGTAYVTPNIGMTGTIGYLNNGVGKFTTIGLTAEWMFSQEMPISGYAGYNYIDQSAGGNFDQFLVGFKIYTSGNGISLVEKHRNGALSNLVRSGLNFLF